MSQLWKAVKQKLTNTDLEDEMGIWMHWKDTAEKTSAMNTAIEEWLD